jgi:8-oxo-dGTP pyrophosphatase MutT (NUDIX family)
VALKARAMGLLRWKRARRVFEVANPWWSYRKDEIVREDGMSGEYHSVHTRGSSMVVPVDEWGRLLMVNQYRYLNGRESLEFPCGSVKDGHDHLATAALELAEETGTRASSLVVAGEHNPCNGVTDEICRVFVATGLSAGPAPKDATEEFELHAVTPAELESFIASGKVWDGMTLAAWSLARNLVDARGGRP